MTGKQGEKGQTGPPPLQSLKHVGILRHMDIPHYLSHLEINGFVHKVANGYKGLLFAGQDPALVALEISN